MTGAIGWAAWVVLSIPMIVLARRDLAHPRTHGFYRLFAYEALLGLLILNLPGWLDRPGSPWQIVSWVLLTAAFALAAHGFYLLKTIGQPDGPVENTTRLVSTGVFRLIRHPLYASIILFSWGIFLIRVSGASALMALAVMALLVLAARAEERESLARFGQDYARYIRETRMFIPFLF